MPRGWGRKFEYEAPPRKAMNAYCFYVQDYYRYIRRVIRMRNPHRVIQEVARWWKDTTATEKQRYIELAKFDKQRAKQEMLAYYEMVARGEAVLPPVRIRKTKQPGYPRSTKNAFVFFSNEIRNAIRTQNPGMSYVEVMRELARRWKQLSENEKKRYRVQKNNDQARYRAAKRQYRQRQKREKQNKRRREGRERLNRLFNRRVPKSRPQPEPAVQRVAA